MKRLICVKDIEDFIKSGKKEFYDDGNMIITPAAKDAAKINNIIFTNESPVSKAKNESVLKVAEVEKCNDTCKTISDNIDTETIIKVFKAIAEKGLMKEILSSLSNIQSLPYQAEKDVSGLKVIRGNTVKMDVFDVGDPNVKAYFQELVSKDESKISAGFLTIENSRFEWELTYEEIDFVIEGILTIEINGKTFVAYPGDVLFVPSGSKVVWGSPTKAKVFYATYPANWADLL